MLTSNIRNQYLVDEMQLGERLNKDVHAGNHADFSLMLAMLSHDLTDHPLYNPIVTEEKEVNLRKKFHLLPEQKKYAQSEDFVRAQFLTEAFSSEGISQVFLAQCIRQEPLTPFQRELSPEAPGWIFYRCRSSPGCPGIRTVLPALCKCPVSCSWWSGVSGRLWQPCGRILCLPVWTCQLMAALPL